MHFNYSLIDEDDFRNFKHNPFNYLRDGEDPRPIFVSSPSRKFQDSLESIRIEFECSYLPLNGESTHVIKGSTFKRLNQSMFLYRQNIKIVILLSNPHHQPHSRIEKKTQMSLESLTQLQSVNQQHFLFEMLLFKKTYLNLKPLIRQFMKLAS